MEQPQNVNWLTVLVTLIIGLPAILGGILAILREIKNNTKITQGTAVEVEKTLIRREAKVDSALRESEKNAKQEAIMVAAKAISVVNEGISGIAETINGHTDKRVEAAEKAAYAEGQMAATDKKIVEIQQWQAEHAKTDEDNMTEIRSSLGDILRVKQNILDEVKELKKKNAS